MRERRRKNPRGFRKINPRKTVKRACHFCPDTIKYLLRGDVAQLVRALRSHRRGRGFEPLHPHHNWTPILIQCVSGWVFISLFNKRPFVGLFRHYLIMIGSTAVFTAPPQSLFLFSVMNNLTIGRYRVHNLTIPQSKIA